MNTENQRIAYLDTAAAVRRRLASVRWGGWLGRSHLLVAGLVVAVVLSLRLFAEWRGNEWIVATGMLALWLLLMGIVATIRLPGPAAALTLLDQRGGWKDCFSSAWEFLNRPNPGEGERLHLSRAAERLPEARAAVPAILPNPLRASMTLAPLLALALSFTPWGRFAPDSRDLLLTSDMQAAAGLQAEELRRDAERIRDLASLTEAEKKELEALRSEVDSVAEALAKPEGLTAGEMLESLEGRARAAERLAEKLGLFSNDWASPEMLAEMARHPDTADLSLLIGDKSAENAATEARRLQGTLEDEALTTETQERFTRSLESIAAAATDEDHVRPVGERFENASRKMRDAQPTTAAREFGELAKFFGELASRKEAREKLEALAENLREAGGEIGGSELKKMEQAARSTAPGQAAPEGLKSIDSENPGGQEGGLPGQQLALGTPDGKQPSAAPGDTPKAPAGGEKGATPGAAPGEGEEGDAKGKGEQAFSAPVPGEKGPEGKSGSGVGQSDQSQDGKGKGGMLSAPIPGMEPGDSGAGAGLTLGGDTSNQSGQGGDQAGTGTAELVDAPSETIKAKGDAEVVAQTGKEGDSTVRAIEGEAKAEEATRTRQEVIADFIAVEEQALDDQALPLSRRQHVLRYFSAIREQFEKAEAK